jgi:YihY family inner membrane protein
MPKGIANTILGYLTQFATKATRLSAVGGIALMITAIATMAMIDKTFNQIWQVKRSRPIFQRILVYWAIITLGPLLIGASISVTSYLFTATSGVVKSVPFIGGIFYTTISIVFTMGAFTLLYLAVPYRKLICVTPPGAVCLLHAYLKFQSAACCLHHAFFYLHRRLWRVSGGTYFSDLDLSLVAGDADRCGDCSSAADCEI